ncbi:MAG: ribokinase [Chlamydiia bacterium]|nr:ribokinase [Chlamydiia bacterium]
MKPKILNYGSLNIDHVYQVPHFVTPGETLSSASLSHFAGGKGANQSVALARAGAIVFHAGKIGTDGGWLKDKLEQNNVNIQFILEGTLDNGHAIIQVDAKGENAIVLYPGANQEMTEEEIDITLSKFDPGDYLLLQNEINLIPYLIEKGHKRGLKVCYNPAPMIPEVADYPLHLCHLLIVNETEGGTLSNGAHPPKILHTLSSRYPETEILLTVGAEGSYHQKGTTLITQGAEKVKAVDTTAAGDTFIGYYLAAILNQKSPEEALKVAAKAAALCVTRPGAMDAIPTREEIP